MNIANQLAHIMNSIWDNSEESEPSIKALASYVKTHGRRNAENVFEVIDILWPRNVRMMKVREVGDGSGMDSKSAGPTENGFDWLVDCQFDDDSQILIICQNGIGHGLEFIS